MEFDLDEPDISFTKGYSPEERKKFEEAVRRWEAEEMGRVKMEDYNAEEMNIIANEKMLRRRRERLMRHIRAAAKKKNSKSQDSESFTSDSDEEMKIAQEEVKRLMEKAIRENMTTLTTARDEVGDAAKIEGEGSKAEEKMFPRRRGRLIRYLRRQRSKSQDSDFQIEFHHLQLQPEESSFMSDSDDSST